jgi:amino acid transporter
VSPKLSSSEFVFTDFENRTGFDSSSSHMNYYLSLIGLLTSLFAFAGYEGAASVAEEVTEPHVNAPRGIMYTTSISFIAGFLVIIA